jgi:hypothetical protein
MSGKRNKKGGRNRRLREHKFNKKGQFKSNPTFTNWEDYFIYEKRKRAEKG